VTDDHIRTGDAWGDALLAFLDGRAVPDLLLDADPGGSGPAMAPSWFFRPFEDWDWWERELLSLIEPDAGPVLDLGAGAGRASLHLQSLGHDVTAVESSPGAAEVCRRRGVADVRCADLNDPPTCDGGWGVVLLLCGNLGLGGSWDGNRALLRRLAERCAPGALLIGDSVEDDSGADLRLRIRAGDVATEWWSQRNVRSEELPALVAGTGWTIDRQLRDGFDHAVALRLR
jgi:SAM-dependent methyltransferase